MKHSVGPPPFLQAYPKVAAFFDPSETLCTDTPCRCCAWAAQRQNEWSDRAESKPDRVAFDGIFTIRARLHEMEQGQKRGNRYKRYDQKHRREELGW